MHTNHAFRRARSRAPLPAGRRARVAALALLPLAALLLAACGDDASGPGDPAPSYDVVFDGGADDGRPRLWRARGDGTSPALVGPGHVGRNPAPRPDGRLVILQTIPADANTLSQVVVVEAGAASARPLEGEVVDGDSEFAWSPDGARVAFTSQRDDAAGDVLVADVIGRRLSNVRNLTPRRDPTSILPDPDRTPAWSPDGQWIAFTSYRDGVPAIWVMRADGTGARAVTAAGNHGDFNPAWSPDGRELAFQRNDATGARIGVVSVSGGAPRFVSWSSSAFTPAWSPDGGAVAFSSVVDNEMDVFLVSPAGVLLKRIERPGPDRNPAFVRRADAGS